MRFRTAVGPVKHYIGCWHYFHSMGVYVHRMLARIERLIPNTFQIFLDNITMFKAVAAGILSFRSYKRVHYANITDRYIDHINLLYQNKPGIKVIGTCQDHVFLQTFTAAGVNKCYWVLKITVTDYRYAGYLTLVE